MSIIPEPELRCPVGQACLSGVPMTGATTEDLIEALRARDRERVNSLAARLLDQRIPLRSEWFDVAKVLASNMEVTLAVKAAHRGVEELGSSASARFRLADLL